MTTSDTVRLHPNRHDLLRAERAGTTIPETIDRDLLEVVVDLKTRGYNPDEIAKEVPEVLSPAGVNVVLLAAVDLANQRRPFDGRPGAPAWTPAGSALSDKLRPLERPTREECEQGFLTELRAAGVPDGCKCWTRDKHDTIILAGNLWCPLCNNPGRT